MATYPNFVTLSELLRRIQELGARCTCEFEPEGTAVITRTCGQLHEYFAVFQAADENSKIPTDVVESIRRRIWLIPELGVSDEKFWDGF